jgi:hypothetical protein
MYKLNSNMRLSSICIDIIITASGDLYASRSRYVGSLILDHDFLVGKEPYRNDVDIPPQIN